MTERTLTQMKTTAPPFAPVSSGVLQRSTVGNQPVNEAPLIVGDVLRSSGQALDPASRAFMAPRFGHDFSHIPVHTKTPARLQTKLGVNTPGDIYEQEADAVAEKVVNQTVPRIQRQAGEGKLVQRKATGDAEVQSAPPLVNEVLRSPGRPLDADTQAFMEPRFGHDFSRVRVHTGTAAEQSARDMNANAYTVGHDIVFAAGRFATANRDGRRLLAHELTHVVQQGDGGSVLQRDVRGPKATATPADWKDKVAKATSPADRAALIQSVVAPVKVVDKSADAAADAAVDPKHCIKWDDANPTVSYDDDLNAKKGRVANAGFTKEITSGPSTAQKTDFYIVLGLKALDATDVTTTTRILNHEFDHVRETRGGSKLTGDESEIATWTTTFVREFHRSYSIRDRRDGVTSYIDPGFATFTSLGGYYARSTDATVKSAAVKEIADYYTATIKPHAVHDKVFRYWIYRGINALNIAALCNDVNDKLGKIVDPTKDVKDYWELPTATVKAAKFTGPPAVAVP